MSYRKRKNKEEEPMDSFEQKNLSAWENRTGRTRGQLPDNRPAVSTLNNMKHGIYAGRFLTAEEKEIFESMIERFHAEYVLNSSADFIQLELACLYYTQLGRAIALEEWQTAERIDSMMRRHLTDLKTIKKSRVGDTAPKGEQEMNATEWAQQLLEKVKARKDEIDADEIESGKKKMLERLQRTPEMTDDDHE
jgi:transcription termination factor NusB